MIEVTVPRYLTDVVNAVLPVITEEWERYQTAQQRRFQYYTGSIATVINPWWELDKQIQECPEPELLGDLRDRVRELGEVLVASSLAVARDVPGVRQAEQLLEAQFAETDPIARFLISRFGINRTRGGGGVVEVAQAMRGELSYVLVEPSEKPIISAKTVVRAALVGSLRLS